MENPKEIEIIFKQNEYSYEEEEEEEKKHEHWPIEFEEIIKRLTDFEAEFTTEEEPLKDHKSAETIITPSSLESKIASSIDTGDSFPPICLKHISISDSQLKFLNIYAFYPIPKDEGIQEAFWKLYPQPKRYQSNGIEKFFDRVAELGLSPISSLNEQLLTDTVDLSYYGLDAALIQPLCEALADNTTVQSLILQESLLDDEACYYLNKLLMRSEVLSSLNLTSSGIGPQGVNRLAEGLSLSSALTELNLTDCGLEAMGCRHLASAISVNTLIRVLDLSNNRLDEEAAQSIYDMLAINDSLEKLNLSWNQLNTKIAAEKISSGFLKNKSIVDVDLSWNAMGRPCVMNLNRFIINTKTVQRLDISANRFTNDEVSSIANALTQNRSLHEFHISKNPITPQGATEFIKILTSPRFLESPMTFLNMETYWPNKIVLPLLENLKIEKPNFTVKYAGILENYVVIGPDLTELYFKIANNEAMAPKKKKEKKNFGHFVLSLPDDKITKDKFEDLVTNSGMKVSPNLIKQIMKQFMVTRKYLSQGAMKEAYMHYFPDTTLPKPKVAKVEESEAEPGKKGKKSKKGSQKKKGKSKKKK